MQEEKNKGIEEIVSTAKEYVDARVEYTRLYIVEKVSKIFADLVTNTAVAVCFILAFLFGTTTLAFFLSDVLGSFTRGFGCVALIYILLAFVVYFTKEKYMEKRLVNFAIRKYFDKLADNDEDE